VRFTLYVSSTILIIELGQRTRRLLHPKMGRPHCRLILLLRKATTLRRRKIKRQRQRMTMKTVPKKTRLSTPGCPPKAPVSLKRNWCQVFISNTALVIVKFTNPHDQSYPASETFVHNVAIKNSVSATGGLKHEIDLRTLVPAALLNLSPIKSLSSVFSPYVLSAKEKFKYR
jgi:hypothetical protein